MLGLTVGGQTVPDHGGTVVITNDIDRMGSVRIVLAKYNTSKWAILTESAARG